MAKFKRKHDTDGYWHEMVDRANTMQVMFDELIVSHPVANCPALKEQIKELQTRLGDLYQSAAEEWFLRFPLKK